MRPNQPCLKFVPFCVVTGNAALRTVEERLQGLCGKLRKHCILKNYHVCVNLFAGKALKVVGGGGEFSNGVLGSLRSRARVVLLLNIGRGISRILS